MAVDNLLVISSQLARLPVCPSLHCVHEASKLAVVSCRLMESYRKDAEQHGAVVAFNCEVVGGDLSGESS